MCVCVCVCCVYIYIYLTFFNYIFYTEINHLLCIRCIYVCAAYFLYLCMCACNMYFYVHVVYS